MKPILLSSNSKEEGEIWLTFSMIQNDSQQIKTESGSVWILKTFPFVSIAESIPWNPCKSFTNSSWVEESPKKIGAKIKQLCFFFSPVSVSAGEDVAESMFHRRETKRGLLWYNACKNGLTTSASLWSLWDCFAVFGDLWDFPWSAETSKTLAEQVMSRQFCSLRKGRIYTVCRAYSSLTLWFFNVHIKSTTVQSVRISDWESQVTLVAGIWCWLCCNWSSPFWTQKMSEMVQKQHCLCCGHGCSKWSIGLESTKSSAPKWTHFWPTSVSAGAEVLFSCNGTMKLYETCCAVEDWTTTPLSCEDGPNYFRFSFDFALFRVLFFFVFFFFFFWHNAFWPILPLQCKSTLVLLQNSASQQDAISLLRKFGPQIAVITRQLCTNYFAAFEKGMKSY